MSIISFNKPFIVGKELDYIKESVESAHTAGDGRFTMRCHEWLEQRLKAKKALLTTSCTDALEMAAALFDIGAGDEVICPSFTFVSTANAFALHKAAIRFVDIRPDTLNIDETLIEQAITEKTKAIVPVHYAGIAAEMDTINAIAKQHGLAVIEDAAQGLDATYKNRYLGTLGDLGAFSFHETKNFISGEGGALLVNDESLIERAEIVRMKGTNRNQFLRGEVDKYTWVDVGSSFLPSDILAAFLYAQLEEADRISQVRRGIYARYEEAFKPLEEKKLVRLPHTPPDCRHNAHLFYLILKDLDTRSDFIAFLKARDIHAVFHYVPLHSSPFACRMGYAKESLPITEELSQRLVRLPFYFELKEAEQSRVIESVFAFFGETP